MSEKVKHIVGFSGGIDSQACARWVLNRFPKEDVILTNSDAGGNEHPLTELFIENYSETVHPVVRNNAIVSDIWETDGLAESRGLNGSDRLTFELLAEIKGCFPHRKMPFCTDKLKLSPQKRWIRETFGANGPFDGWTYIRYSGVRREESKARVKTPYSQWDEWFDCERVAPLMDWTKQMCFDYVKFHGEEINPLYSMGFNRVGCAPCINSGKEDILNWSTRFPAMIDKIRAWEERVGKSFFAPSVPGIAINNVDQVVEWAKTSRGGRQQPFPIFHEREACESKYGLCE